jgi:hypothetical protein
MLTWLRREAYSLLPIQWREESRDIQFLKRFRGNNSAEVVIRTL